jgi:hypothetical protein
MLIAVEVLISRGSRARVGDVFCYHRCRGGAATEAFRISIDAPDRVALLVRWLSELNYRHITEHRIFSKFEVVTLSEQHLEADAAKSSTRRATRFSPRSRR